MSRLSAPEATPTNLLDRPPAAARSLLARLGGGARAAGVPGRPDAPAPLAGAGGLVGRGHRAAARAPGRAGRRLPAARASPPTSSSSRRTAPGSSSGGCADGEAIESVLIPSGSAPHPLHLVPGRLRPQMLVLRHRPDGVPAQPVRLRDRGPGAGDRAAGPGGRPHQRGVHGDGRAAAQLAGGGRRAHDPQRARTASASARGTSRSRPSASCPASRRSRGGRSSSGSPSRCTPRRRPSGWASCRSRRSTIWRRC